MHELVFRIDGLILMGVDDQPLISGQEQSASSLRGFRALRF